MDLGLSSKKGIVCAASKGLGRAVAYALAREGVNLVINARSEGLLTATAKEIRGETGVEVVPVAADITTEAGREAVLAACSKPGHPNQQCGRTATRRFSAGDAG